MGDVEGLDLGGVGDDVGAVKGQTRIDGFQHGMTVIHGLNADGSLHVHDRFDGGVDTDRHVRDVFVDVGIVRLGRGGPSMANGRSGSTAGGGHDDG